MHTFLEEGDFKDIGGGVGGTLSCADKARGGDCGS